MQHVGVVLGTFTGIRYVKCIRSRGKTGLTSVVVAGYFFLLALYISPSSAVISEYMTSPALIMAEIFMIKGLRDLTS